MTQALRDAIDDIDKALKEAEQDETPYSDDEMVEILALRESMEAELKQEGQNG